MWALLLMPALGVLATTARASGASEGSRQTPAALPEPAAVFAAAAEAMGGTEAIREIRSIRAIADCSSPMGDYITEVVSARGDRAIFRQIWAGSDPLLAFVSGKHAWSRNEQTGKITPLDATMTAIVRGHEFQMIALAPLERYRDARIEGYEEFAGGQAIRMLVRDGLGNPRHLFFGTDSRLMAGMIESKADGAGAVRVVFNEWSRAGKLRLPSLVTVTDESGDFILRFHTITLNDADADAFEVPEQVKKPRG
jgi:hypothetical protein